MTPGLNSGASDEFVVLVPLVAPVVLPSRLAWKVYYID